MIESVHFKNFKALRDTTLPLGRFTLIVGANGSGKSTALQGIAALGEPGSLQFKEVLSVGAPLSEKIVLTASFGKFRIHLRCGEQGGDFNIADPDYPIGSISVPPDAEQTIRRTLSRIQVFSLDANAIARPVELVPHSRLDSDGGKLAVVLDQLRDEHPEYFETLNQGLNRWLPEYDRILFETPGSGTRSIGLRTAKGGHLIKASNLSDGTLIALALLTLAHLPDPPSVVCLEEPDHGLHPRLLRDVRDAIYRLAYPESGGESREPVQVIATTHNPYFLDLFQEHPEEVVIAEKEGLEAKFSRLSDHADLEEILGDAHLAEVWYSGILGGVPARP